MIKLIIAIVLIISGCFFGSIIDFTEKDIAGKQNEMFNSSFEVMMKLTHFIIRFTPLGILGIVVGVVAEQRENLVEVLGSLGKYSITVLIGLIIHSAITLPLILRTITSGTIYSALLDAI